MISIILPYRNTKKELIATLDSIQSQLFSGDFEVVVVDEGSDEDQRIENLKNDFPFLEIIRIEKNDGWFLNSGISYNLGANKAKGDTIILQKPNIIYHGKLLEETEKLLTKDSLLQFPAYYSDSVMEPIGLPNKKADEKNAGWLQHPIYADSASFYCLALNKSDFEKIGGFDEMFALGKGYEDIEFLWRLNQLNLQKKNSENSAVQLVSNPFSIPSSVQEEQRNLLLFAEYTKEKTSPIANRVSKNLSLSAKKKHLEKSYHRNQISKKYAKKIENLVNYFRFNYQLRFNSLVKSQLKNPLSIPVIIINYNQLFYLRQLIDFLKERKFENIVIIDNCSTYPPLLEFYEENKNSIKVEHMKTNDGHMVFFKNKKLQEKYGKGFYFLTDADIVPNKSVPKNFVLEMIRFLKKYFRAVTKVGFALGIDDIPDFYPLKEKVQSWEKNYWTNEIEKNVFKTRLDTTFALYKPGYPHGKTDYDFYKALRLAGDYTCKHGGWYMDPKHLTDEQEFYYKTSTAAGSWITQMKD